MRMMKKHEGLLAYGGKNLFCRAWSFTKQIFNRKNAVFIFIKPHNPHSFFFHKAVVHTTTPQELKNMRVMKEHEDMVFKGFYLFRIVNRGGAVRKYEDGFEKYEDYLHVFAPPIALWALPPNTLRDI